MLRCSIVLRYSFRALERKVSSARLAKHHLGHPRCITWSRTFAYTTKRLKDSTNEPGWQRYERAREETASRRPVSIEEFEKLAKRVQVVIHSGATVNLVYPYSALRDVNVYGTREILRLACMNGATVQYVSTNGVLSPSKEGWSEESSLLLEDVPTKIADGYGQTKWVSEKLLLEAGKRGLRGHILRPGYVVGDSRTAGE